jgi:hypothetical protein
MPTCVWLVERMLEGDDWQLVKVFSTEALAADYVDTCVAVSLNVYWRTHRAEVDRVGPEEPYAAVKRARAKAAPEFKQLLQAELNLARARLKSLGGPAAEARAAVAASKRAFDDAVVATLAAGAYDLSYDDQLLRIPAVTERR